MTMVERVARAILKARFYDPEPDMYGHDLERFHREMDRDQADEAKREARAAIDAMREPSDAMRKVSTFKAAEVDWPAMIDAALEEGE